MLILMYVSMLTQMFEGKERRLELIHELRTTHALQDTGQKAKEREKSSLLTKQRQEAANEHKDQVLQDLTEEGPAEELGRQLDYLNKELYRLQVSSRSL